MTNEWSDLEFPRVVKPLLREALGVPFLAYVLDSSIDDIEQWFRDTGDDFGTPQQTFALSQLHMVLHGTRGEDTDTEARRLNIASILGIYREDVGTTLVNVIRYIASGNNLPGNAPASLDAVLSRLVEDIYPIYLLPSEHDPFAHTHMSFTLYRHPLRAQLGRAITADSALANLLEIDGEALDKQVMLLRSTGNGGTVQPSILADSLIGAGWRAARLAKPGIPSLREHLNHTLDQLRTIRSAAAGRNVKVPARVGLTGVKLVSAEPIDLGWGILRQVDSRDDQLIPVDIKGQLTAVDADGVEFSIDYSGDVVLDTAIDYKVRSSGSNFEVEWPAELRDYERISELVESVQLGALISQDFIPTEPVTVLPTWRHTHDPFNGAFGNLGWSDPRHGKGFTPKKLDTSAAESWGNCAKLVQQYRTKYIEVAIRRTLRAAAERTDFADVLVDSVIAWENLVGSQKGEPTLRVTGALSWLLEPADSRKRLELQSELSKLYGLRSKVVHGNRSIDNSILIPNAQRALGVSISALRTIFNSRLELLTECKDGDTRSNRLLMGG